MDSPHATQPANGGTAHAAHPSVVPPADSTVATAPPPQPMVVLQFEATTREASAVHTKYSHLDQPSAHEPVHGKVHMQTVVGLVPLGHPHVGQRVATQPSPQPAPEVRHIGA